MSIFADVIILCYFNGYNIIFLFVRGLHFVVLTSIISDAHFYDIQIPFDCKFFIRTRYSTLKNKIYYHLNCS